MGTHEFIATFQPQYSGTPEGFAALIADPPEGCTVEDIGGGAHLMRCQREGTDMLAAITSLVAEARQRYGVQIDDLGVEKLWEWGGRGASDSIFIASQLLLMGAERLGRLDIDRTRMVALIDALLGTAAEPEG